MEIEESMVGPKLEGNQEFSVGCGRFEMPRRDLSGGVDDQLVYINQNQCSCPGLITT